MNFAETCQIGLNPIETLGATWGNAKTGHDFIENQHHPSAITERAQTL